MFSDYAIYMRAFLQSPVFQPVLRSLKPVCDEEAKREVRKNSSLLKRAGVSCRRQKKLVPISQRRSSGFLARFAKSVSDPRRLKNSEMQRFANTSIIQSSRSNRASKNLRSTRGNSEKVEFESCKRYTRRVSHNS